MGQRQNNFGTVKSYLLNYHSVRIQLKKKWKKNYLTCPKTLSFRPAYIGRFTACCNPVSAR